MLPIPLSWRLDDRRPGAVQTAYAVTVGTDSMTLADGWSTGRRDFPRPVLTYDGPALRPFTRYYWRVEVWDKDGQRSVSQVTSFETGMVDMANWKAPGSATPATGTQGRSLFPQDIRHFQKDSIGTGLYSAAGLYELYINGKKIGIIRLDSNVYPIRQAQSLCYV